MGYGHNAATVESRMVYLTDLAAGRPAVWLTEKDPAVTRRFALNIREALHIARFHHSSLYPELAAAYDSFSIHIVEDGRIEARYRSISTIRTELAEPGVSVHGIEAPNLGFKAVAQVGISTAAQCIDSWQRHLPSSDPVRILRTSLDLGELLKLNAFCSQNTPSLMMLVGDDQITLSLYEAGVAAIAGWQPPQEILAEEEFLDL